MSFLLCYMYCLRAAQISICGIFGYLITLLSVSSCAIFQNDLGLWAKEHLVKSTRGSTDIEMGMRWKCLWLWRYVLAKFILYILFFCCISYEGAWTSPRVCLYMRLSVWDDFGVHFYINTRKVVKNTTNDNALCGITSRILLRFPTFFLIVAINPSPSGRNLLPFLYCQWNRDIVQCEEQKAYLLGPPPPPTCLPFCSKHALLPSFQKRNGACYRNRATFKWAFRVSFEYSWKNMLVRV